MASPGLAIPALYGYVTVGEPSLTHNLKTPFSYAFSPKAIPPKSILLETETVVHVALRVRHAKIRSCHLAQAMQHKAPLGCCALDLAQMQASGPGLQDSGV